MPYLPDLIPKDRKVIPEYFHKQPVGTQQPKADAGAVLLGLVFLIIAVCFIRYAGFAALFGLLVISCTNGGRRWLERAGRFSLTGVARVVIYGLMILVSVPVYLGYVHQDEVDAAERAAAHARAVKFTADSLVQDSSRKVALYAVLDKASQMPPDKGLELIGGTDSLVKTTAEKDSVEKLAGNLQFQVVQRQFARKDYEGSLRAVQQLLDHDHTKPELWYYRARCYIGLGKMQLAVNDLDSAKALNYKPADRLFEQVNPLKKRITGYCTLCADGSISFATGRGACSWHGGVAEWNHPMYETYRKYGD